MDFGQRDGSGVVLGHYFRQRESVRAGANADMLRRITGRIIACLGDREAGFGFTEIMPAVLTSHRCAGRGDQRDEQLQANQDGAESEHLAARLASISYVRQGLQLRVRT